MVWFQGCTLGCVGCFNPTTHAPDAGATELRHLVAPLERAAHAGAVSGLTLSGGEPMQQAPAALELLLAARRLGLSTLMFSGYRHDELIAQPLGPAVLAHLDVLIDGRYLASERLGRGLRGSANQRVHFLTGRHTQSELDDVPTTEVRIAADGSLSLTGVDPLTTGALRRSARDPR